MKKKEYNMKNTLLFAQWIGKNNYIQEVFEFREEYEKDAWYEYEYNTTGNKIANTTEELYELFLNDLENDKL